MASCMPWLQRQIATIQPKLICGLGNIAVQTLLVTKTGITKLRGKDLRQIRRAPDERVFRLKMNEARDETCGRGMIRLQWNHLVRLF